MTLKSITDMLLKGISVKNSFILMVSVAVTFVLIPLTEIVAKDLSELFRIPLIFLFSITACTLVTNCIEFLLSKSAIFFRWFRNTVNGSWYKIRQFKAAKDKEKLTRRSFFSDVDENKIQYLSLFYGESIESAKNSHGLVPKEYYAFYESLCVQGLMTKEKTSPNGSSYYTFSLEKKFAIELRKRFFKTKRSPLPISLPLAEIQVNIVTTGGGLASGSTRNH
jgi:hypothetical protein